MKNILFLFIVIGSVLLTSCSDVAVIPPGDALSAGSIFGDSTNTVLAVTGVYNSMQSQQFGYNGGGDPRGYPFGAGNIEQGEMRGEDLVNTQGFYAVVYLNTQTPTAPNVINLWAGLYEVINQANTVIKGLEGTTAISAGLRERYIGEMKFIRALAHWELVVYFCRPYSDPNNANPVTNPGIPYRTFPAQDDVDGAIALVRGSVHDVYPHILADLDAATARLPITRDDNQVTRATLGAALALKARVYLHMGDYANVVVASDSVNTIDAYALSGAPDDSFTNQFSKENIFFIEWSSTDQGSVNGGLGSAFLPGALDGRGLIGVSPNLYNASFWPADDARRDAFLVQDEDETYYIGKYKDPATNTDWAPVLRYPEVILNHAEALARLGGNDGAALTLLNLIRGRSTTAYSGLTGSALLTAILNERRIELIGEGFRWQDLSRQGLDIPTKLLFNDYDATSYDAASGTTVDGSVLSIPYSDHRWVYPVSQTEILNNATMTQNPGY